MLNLGNANGVACGGFRDGIRNDRWFATFLTRQSVSSRRCVHHERSGAVRARKNDVAGAGLNSGSGRAVARRHRQHLSRTHTARPAWKVLDYLTRILRTFVLGISRTSIRSTRKDVVCQPLVDRGSVTKHRQRSIASNRLSFPLAHTVFAAFVRAAGWLHRRAENRASGAALQALLEFTQLQR